MAFGKTDSRMWGPQSGVGMRGETSVEWNLRDYLRIIRQRIWVIISCAVVAVLLVVIQVQYFTTLQYEANTSLWLNDFATHQIDYYTILSSEKLANTYAEIIRSRSVLGMVVAKMHSKLTMGQLASRLKVTSISDTQIMEISMVDSDPIRARDVVNTVAEEFIAFYTESRQQGIRNLEATLQGQLSKIQGTLQQATKALASHATTGVTLQQKKYASTLQDDIASYRNTIDRSFENSLANMRGSASIFTLDKAVTPGEPITPKGLQSVAIALLVGLVGGLVLAFLTDVMDNTIKDSNDLSKTIGIPVLAVVPLAELVWQPQAKHSIREYS